MLISSSKSFDPAFKCTGSMVAYVPKAKLKQVQADEWLKDVGWRLYYLQFCYLQKCKKK